MVVFDSEGVIDGYMMEVGMYYYFKLDILKLVFCSIEEFVFDVIV